MGLKESRKIIFYLQSLALHINSDMFDENMACVLNFMDELLPNYYDKGFQGSYLWGFSCVWETHRPKDIDWFVVYVCKGNMRYTGKGVC